MPSEWMKTEEGKRTVAKKQENKRKDSMSIKESLAAVKQGIRVMPSGVFVFF